MLKIFLKKNQYLNQRLASFTSGLGRPFATWNSPEDSRVDIVSYFKDDYTEENIKKIEEYQQMSYQSLLEEAKKYPNKPKARNKNVVLQFLIDQLPKKVEDTSDPTKHGAANEEIKFSEIDHKGHEEYSQIHKIINQSIVFNNIRNCLPAFEDDVLHLDVDKPIPYIETYKTSRIDHELNALRHMDFKREMDYFLQRSRLFSKTNFSQKIRKVPKENLKNVFRDLILLEKEHGNLFQNHLKHALTESKPRASATLEYLEILRSFNSPVNLWQMNLYLKNLAPTSLLKFWRVIFNSLDSINISTSPFTL